MKRTPSRPEALPGAWFELALLPVEGGGGLGPALGWLAGALASGAPLWPWPHLGRLILGFLLAGPLWARLWGLFGSTTAPRPKDQAHTVVENPAAPQLPYTKPGSLSAASMDLLRRLRRRWQSLDWTQRQRLLELPILSTLLLALTGMGGGRAFLTGVAGLTLLLLHWLTRQRPLATSLLRVLAGLAWPWWLGHSAWAPPTGASLLLSLLWGTAYAGWAAQGDQANVARPHLQAVLAQAAVAGFFFLRGRTLVGGGLAFTLLGQVLLQAGLGRAGRGEEIPRRTWPFAAAGLLLSGLALGAWV